MDLAPARIRQLFLRMTTVDGCRSLIIEKEIRSLMEELIETELKLTGEERVWELHGNIFALVPILQGLSRLIPNEV